MSEFERRQSQTQSSHLVRPTKPDRARPQPSHTENPLLAQQQVLGNQAVQCLLRSLVIQAKLRIGQPGDKYEQEADRVAKQVVQMQEPQMASATAVTHRSQIQRACAKCEEELQRQVEEEEEEETLRAKPLADQITPLVQRQVEPEEEEELIQAKLADGAQVQRQEEEPEEEEEEVIQTKQADGKTPQACPGLEVQIRSLRGGGQPLPESARNFFGPRFGYDFSQVRVHTDGNAARLARAVSARAFTRGQDIVFRRGQYAPGTSTGRRLLAHELTHVVQQNAGKGFHRSPNLKVGALTEEGSIQCAFFTRGKLQRYLRHLKTTGKIEGKGDSDDKAIAVVHWWSARVHGFRLNRKIKSLLTLEMLTGSTYDPEEQAILELLERSSNSDLSYIFTKGGITPQALKNNFHGVEYRWLKEFFDRRFEGGWGAALKGRLAPKGRPISRSLPLFAIFPERAEGKASGLAEVKLRKYIRKIDVKFTSVKDIARILWWFNKSGLRKGFPGLHDKRDFRFDAGYATATYGDGAKENFPVTGGAIKLARFRTHRTGRRYVPIHRKGGESYVNINGDPMPHASFFYRGQAFHGCGTRNWFLNLSAEYYCLDCPSHGCIHVKNSTMAKLYPFILVRRTKVRVA